MKGAGLGLAVIGGIMAGIGMIWAVVVGFYPSDLPALAILLLGGITLLWIGSRMNRDKNPTAAVEWSQARASQPQSTPAAPPAPVAEAADVPMAQPTAPAPSATAEPIVGPAQEVERPRIAASEAVDDRTQAVVRRPRAVALELADGSQVLVVDALIVGREPRELPHTSGGVLCALPAPDSTVSQTHAVFRRMGRTVTVEDLGSTNGTLIIGADGAETACPAGTVVEVPIGSTVELGTYPARVVGTAVPPWAKR